MEQQILQCDNPTLPSDHPGMIELQNRIVELEAQNAKLKAKATQTLPKEDPITWETSRQGNAAAYENDMKNLFTR
ncbi:MAG: hypothetical protein LUD68_03460 [Rikenellaceae bacterium]|nr:hypothetical protein [Rikenellaceae bacterium]